MTDLFQTICDLRTASDGGKNHIAWRAHLEAQRAARQAFAELNGWRVSESRFPFSVLAAGRVHAGDRNWLTKHDPSMLPLMDHLEFFRDADPPYRAAAIVSHPYPKDVRSLADLENWAEGEGLQVERPELLIASWYWPGNTWCLCLTRPGVSVSWLAEQSDPRWHR